MKKSFARAMFAALAVFISGAIFAASPSTPSTGLGQAWPNTTDVSAHPNYHVYAFTLGGIRYLQVNDMNGNVLGAVGTAGGQFITLPMGRFAQLVATPQQPAAIATRAKPAATTATVYNDGATAVTATPMTDGTVLLRAAPTQAVCDPIDCNIKAKTSAVCDPIDCNIKAQARTTACDPIDCNIKAQAQTTACDPIDCNIKAQAQTTVCDPIDCNIKVQALTQAQVACDPIDCNIKAQALTQAQVACDPIDCNIKAQ
ncbi:hypothetical protein SAMN05216570_3417 [Dyella sp. OK004]|uniref:hypothetical protein n=1 Tax=Dyella sp. OK004 TaxID=1855292 RepID=UPI0008E152EA|nr:hypothetical protein [Dyella sp. OK004]SFS16920.1 hypothetical protein SAMN05216570_3417 [Dyella sp. OK004]